jgi:uncharacterized protein
MERVTFTSSGLTIAGDLHMPDGGGAGLPALALTGPLTGVKDQVVGVYAKRLAERGFVALAFDHRNFGESEGTPRQHEDQAGKVVDLRDAVSYLASRPEVDPDRIGIVGVCLGGSYAVKSAAFDPRVRAVAGIAAAYNSPHRRRLGALGAPLEGEEEAAEVAYMPAVSQEGPAAMGGEEPFAYYGTERSKSAVWENRLSLASFWQLMTLDALSAVALLDQTPFLVVHGKIDAYCTPEGAQIAFDRAPGPKEIEWLDTSNHIDLYDQPQFVDAAVDRTAAFFAERLAGDRVAA